MTSVSNGLGSSHPRAVKHDVGAVILPPIIVGLLPMARNDKIVASEVIFPVAGEALPRPSVTSGVPCLH
jgi:hypothetical protein